MAQTLTTPTIGAPPLETKQQIQNSHWYQLDVCGLYPPENLGNIFMYRKVDHLDGPPVSSYMEEILGARSFLELMR